MLYEWGGVGTGALQRQGTCSLDSPRGDRVRNAECALRWFDRCESQLSYITKLLEIRLVNKRLLVHAPQTMAWRAGFSNVGDFSSGTPGLALPLPYTEV